MDRSVASLDSCDADLYTPPETTTTRPNPFEEDDASSRKRRRTSASASKSPSQQDSFGHDAAANNSIHLCGTNDVTATPEDVTATPEASAHITHTPEAPGSPTSLDPAGQLTLSLRRIVDDNRENILKSKSEFSGTRRNIQPSSRMRASSEDRDMMDQSSDDTSSAKDDFHEPVLRLTHYLVNEPDVDAANLEMLSIWMQSTIKFFEESDRSIILLTLQSHRKFWLSFPAVMNALTTTQAHGSSADSIIPAIHNILSLYSLFTAALVKFDNATLELALAGKIDFEEELALVSVESLHIWYDLLYIEERQPSTSDRRNIQSTWTRSEMSIILFSRFLGSHGNTTQWISKFAYNMSKFSTPPKFRVRDFALVVSILGDCISEEYRAGSEEDSDSNAVPPPPHLRHARETWLALSDAFLDIIDKNISALNNDTANRLLRSLSEIFAFVCRTDGGKTSQPDGVDQWLENYRSNYPSATAEVLKKGAPWQWRLRVLSKLIQSGLMQLRVMAVNTLGTSLSDMWAQEEGSDDSRDFIRHLGQIVNNELFEQIAGPSSHPEIILAGANAVVFLAISDMGTEMLLDQLWSSIQTSQDPRVADAITRVTNNVISVLSYTNLVHLCEKFDRVELKDFSPLLRQLWEASVGEMVSKAQLNSQALTAHPFLSSLRVLREVPTCENGARYMYADLQIAARQRVKELLSYGLEPDVRHELYRNCVLHLESDSKTTLGSLWFLSICMRPAIAGELQYLTETHDIVRVIVEELESALKSASSQQKLVLAGHANQARRDFISQILYFQPKSLTEELGARLWEALVGSKALNAADRSAAWQTISTVGKNSAFQNSFLQTCFSRYLPHLSPEWYCEGMLSFVKDNTMLLVSDGEDFNLDNEELVAQSGVEHLWRIIRFAQDENIARSAIALLAVGVYLDSGAITSCTVTRAQNIHLNLVRQCLSLMHKANDTIQNASSEDAADDDSIVVVEPEREISQQKREFLRTLRLLHYFLDAYRKNPRYATVDLRSLVPNCAEDMKGDEAELHYQTFGDDNNSEIQSLRIGQENTLASLLATLRDLTGFQSYKAYYRGQLFCPTELEVGKSLRELGMLHGLILLHKDAAAPEMPSHIKPGSSPIEIEILTHFPQLWHYLIMEESIAIDAYSFLVRLPADGQLKERLSKDGCKYEDEFNPDQPFRLLYTIFALIESVKDVQSRPCSTTSSSETTIIHEPYSHSVFNALYLLARGLDDERITEIKPDRLRVQITTTMLAQFVRLLDVEDTVASPSVVPNEDIPKPSASRILSILDSAMKSSEEEYAHLSAKCLTLILRLGLVDNQFWSAIAGDTSFPELMRRSCVLSNKKQFRHFCVSLIEDVAKREAQTEQSDGCITTYFWSWALETLAATPILQEDCHELLKLIGFLIGKMHETHAEIIKLEGLVQTFAKRLIEHTCTEDINQVDPCDVVAESLVNLLHACIHLDLSLAQSVSSASIFVLMKKHLFPHDEYGFDDSLPSIILNPETRRKLYECIFMHFRGYQDMLPEALQFLDEMVPFYTDGEPYIYDLPFSFEYDKALRSPAGYVGLQNLSNTCYLNSLVTQLYMNTSFRSYLTSFDVDEADETKALLYETKKLFGFLQESINRAVDPSTFVGTIKTYDQGPIDIHNQMDVDEFYNLLFDRWEAQLPNAAAKKQFRSIYGGQLVQQIKSKECGHISERLEPFSAIQCDIKGNSTLEDSLRAYVGGEIMDGDNKYKCSSCDRHVDAVKRACLKEVPDNVIFHLKRFEFNLQTLQRSKIDDHFAFPYMLDLQPYTVEYLSGSIPQNQQDMFELVGVLVHAGTAESGHYYSYVRERSPNKDAPVKWVEFNDDQVSIWNPASMETSTFGGPERQSIYEENGVSFDKSYSAYMLFYQRVSQSRPVLETQLSTQAGEPAPATIDGALKEHIRHENLLLLRRHCLFDPSHASFVQACVHRSMNPDRSLRDVPSEGDGGSQIPYRLAIETALSYLDQIFSRSKDPSFAISFCNVLADLATKHGACALSIFQYFQSRPAIFRSLLLRNPEKHIRAAVGHLFITCLETLSKTCPQLFYALPKAADSTNEDEDEEMGDDETGNGTILFQAVRLLDHLWKYFHHHIRAWDEYFSTVLRVARLGRHECSAILAADYLEKCLNIILADRSLELEQNFAKMLQNVYRRMAGQPPSYVAVLATIDYLMSRLEPEISHETIVETADERFAYDDEYLPWTAAEVARLLKHQDEDDTSFFMKRLLEIDQAPEITRRILERILRAGELPTSKLLNLLQQTIRGDATTEPLDAYIRASSVVVNSCSLISDAQGLIQHISAQAASFQGGEGAAFLGLIWQAIENNRSSEEEHVQMRVSTLRVTPTWAPYMLQYPDAPVRAGAEQLIDAALRSSSDEADPEDGEAAALPGEIGLAIGMTCLSFVQEVHIKRRTSIEREFAEILLRVLSKCNINVTESETLDEAAKEDFIEQYQDAIEQMAVLVVDRAEEEGSDWDGSALTSEPMEEDADTEEAVALLRTNGYA
ncbi:hypothetical protein NLG97_g4280 [Lecanicillium saksenae]|uniref:Uncharacterized protein n=1 Tax=Lecanicillium saksenae TaxID=468837 RepID=A0ACC1QVX2_9HYPO|nr:hypothetical protein NLG97_g4280 [Lecanicillium saksenae]